MIEYWLQKKTIGGWSNVTWYDTIEEARKNYDNVAVPNSGYSWRLMECMVVAEKLLDEVVKIEPPIVSIKEDFVKSVWATPADKKPLPDLKKSNPWTDGRSNGWNSTSNAPSPAGFNSTAGLDLPSASVLAHGGKGKVCMINHVAKVRTKVDASRVEEYIKMGWEHGGPRTAFRT